MTDEIKVVKPKKAVKKAAIRTKPVKVDDVKVIKPIVHVLMKKFDYSTLDSRKQSICKNFYDLADAIDKSLIPSTQKTRALNMLLKAKTAYINIVK